MTEHFKKIIALIILTFTVFIRCAPPRFSADVRQQSQTSDYFSDSVTNFEVAVFYEDGAAPYADELGNGGRKTWDVTKESYKALFQTHIKRTLTIPDSLTQMKSFAYQNRAIWTEPELVQLAKSLVKEAGPNQRLATVLFVHGNYNGDKNILGVSFTGFRFTFIFKDIVVGVGGDSTFQHYAEQATIVHELGHVVGLVNNGLPMYQKHEDRQHPNHSSDFNDVMFWHFNSTQKIAASVKAIAAGVGLTANQSLNLFGQGSLEDAWHFHSP